MELAVVATWNRRDRGVAAGTIVLGVFAAVVAFVLLTRSHDESAFTSSTRPGHVAQRRTHGHLVFGMNPKQVLRRTGHPIKKQGGCWLFAPSSAGIVGSISVQPSWSRLPYNPRTQGGLRLCFTGGHYSFGYQHLYDPRKHKWVWFAWPQTLAHGSSDYDSGL